MVGIVLFTLQAAGAVVLYVAYHMQSFERAARVLGSPTVLPGASVVFRAGLVDAASSRPAATDRVAASIGDAALAVERRDGTEFAIVRGIAPAGGGAAAAFLFEGPGVEGQRNVDGPLAATAARWLTDPTTYRRPPAPRNPDLNVDVGGDPEVTVRTGPNDTCPLTLHVAPAGGAVAKDLHGRVWMLLADAAGAPSARARIAFARRADEGPGVARQPTSPAGATPESAQPGDDRAAGRAGDAVVRVTDGVGVAWLDARLNGPATYDVAFDCGGGTVDRTLVVVPSWDGISMRPTSSTFVVGEPWTFEAEHQRSWGDWHIDAWCDGAWVWTDTRPVVGGLSGLAVQATLPPTDTPRLCWVQGYLYGLSPDSPRSGAWLLVRPAGTGARDAVAAFAAEAAHHGAGPLRTAMAHVATHGLAAASDADVDRLASWALAALPQPFLPWRVWLDDGPTQRAAFLARKGGAQRSLQQLLALDLAVLLMGIVGFMAPRMRAQRRALASFADDGEQLDGHADARWTLVFGSVTLVTAVLGLVVLFAYMA